MQTITMVLVLLLTVAISSFVARLLPLKLPLPLIQIVSGAVLSALMQFDVRLAPKVFFLLFIPPLLFLDGWRIPKDSLLCDLRSMLLLATELVFLTIVAMGPLIHSLVPSIPLAVAFALAASRLSLRAFTPHWERSRRSSHQGGRSWKSGRS